MIGSFAAVAVAILLLHGQLCEATGFSIGNEDRVIAEAVVTDGGSKDTAFADPLKKVSAAIPDEGDDGPEPGAAVGGVAQPAEELVNIVFGVALITRVVSAVDPGFAVKGLDL